MSIIQHLTAAGVPAELHMTALSCIDRADKASRGLTWAKWKVRLFQAGKISKMLEWEDERLCLKHPDLADWDIAPMVNITAHGDNPPWEMTPEGGRPVPGRWLNKDPESAEYRQAVADNYWCKGAHPRSKKSRKAWYRRNAGEYRAWRLGVPVDIASGVHIWQAGGVTVYRCGEAWLIVAVKKLVGKLHIKTRIGYEIDNLCGGTRNVQAWYPIPGHELKAPVTWSNLPTFKQPAIAGFFTPE